MRRLVVVIVLVVVAAFLYRTLGDSETGTGNLTLAQPAPNVGDTAETFTAPSEEGGDFSLTDDGVYVLAFWNTLNRQSLDARSGFEDLAREYGNEGIEFAVVYVNSAPDDRSTNYEVLQDRSGRLISDYNAKRVPRLFLIEDGVVRLVQDGYYEGYDQQLEAEIRQYIGEREGGR